MNRVTLDFDLYWKARSGW